MSDKHTTNRTIHYISAVLLAAAGVALDQFTKHLASVRLKDQPSFPIIKDVFELQYLENRGAAFGLLKDQQVFFLVSAVVVCGAVLWFFARVPVSRRFMPLRLCAVFIMAGAVGNCIDRAAQKYVIDFLYFKLIDFPIFNVADIYVTVATFILAFLVLFYYKEEELELIFPGRKEKREEV